MFVALGMQHAMRMRHIVICSLSGCTVFFDILSYKERHFRKKVTAHKMCVFIIFIVAPCILVFTHSFTNRCTFIKTLIKIYIKLDGCYMFHSTAIIRELAIEPGLS